jgi:hypothetical protein
MVRRCAHRQPVGIRYALYASFISSTTFKLLSDTSAAPPRCRPSTGPSTFVAAIFSIMATAVSTAVCLAQTYFKPHCLFVPVRVANVYCVALYDSGAEVSCIHDSVFRSFSPDLRPWTIPSPHPQFRSASGDALQVRGVFSISISLLGKTIQHEFWVIKNLSRQIILGADFINQHALAYCPLTTTTHWATPSTWESGVAQGSDLNTVNLMSSSLVPDSLFTTSLAHPASRTPLLFISAKFPALSGGLAPTQSDKFGKTVVEVPNLSVQLQNCVFGSTHVHNVGFLLSKDGIQTGTDKLKAVQLAAPPTSITKVCQFLGLCKSFRTHVRHFTQNDSGFTVKVPLPAPALTAFRTLQSIICSDPGSSFPRRDRQYGICYTDNNMPANFFSCNAANSINLDRSSPAYPQDNGPSLNSVIKEGALWARLHTSAAKHVVIMDPPAVISSILTEAHIRVLAGHDALLATKKQCQGVSSASAMFQTLHFAKQTAVSNNLNSDQKSSQDFKKSAKPHAFAINRMVLLYDYKFLNLQKLSLEFSGPHFLLSHMSTHNVALVIVNVRRLTSYYFPPSLVYWLVGMKIPPGVSPLPFSVSLQPETAIADQTVQNIVSAAEGTVSSPTLSHSDGAPELSLPLTLEPPAPLLGAPRRRGRPTGSCPPPPPSFSQNDGGICYRSKTSQEKIKRENKLKANTHISPGENVTSLGKDAIGFWKNAIGFHEKCFQNTHYSRSCIVKEKNLVSKGDIYKNQKAFFELDLESDSEEEQEINNFKENEDEVNKEEVNKTEVKSKLSKQATERNKIKMTIVLFILSNLFLSVDASAEHVVFERIGQMSGATSFIHVHVTLGIGLITEQLDTYRTLLNTSFGNREEIMEMFRKNIPNNIKTDPKMQESYFNSMAVLWMKITAQHC